MESYSREGTPPKEPVKTKNKGGRPRKEQNQKVNKRISLNGNNEEIDLIWSIYRTNSIGRSTSLNEFIKDLIFKLGQNPKSKSKSPKRPTQKGNLVEFRIDLHSIKQKLTGLTNNYNQIAKQVNSVEEASFLKAPVMHSLDVLNQIQKVLEQLTILLESINQTSNTEN